MNEAKFPLTPTELRDLAAIQDLWAAGSGPNDEQSKRMDALLTVAGRGDCNAGDGAICRHLADLIESRAPERLAKDPHLAVLPSGRKVSLRDVKSFEAPKLNDSEEGGIPGAFLKYSVGTTLIITGRADIAAVDAALNRIGVYVNAPTLPGEDADGDGKVG